MCLEPYPSKWPTGRLLGSKDGASVDIINMAGADEVGSLYYDATKPGLIPLFVAIGGGAAMPLFFTDGTYIWGIKVYPNLTRRLRRIGVSFSYRYNVPSKHQFREAIERFIYSLDYLSP